MFASKLRDVAVVALNPWRLTPVEFSPSPYPFLVSGTPAVTASAHSGGGAKSHETSQLVVIGGIVAGVIILITFILAAMFCWQRRQELMKKSRVSPASAIAMTNFGALRINSSDPDSFDTQQPSLVRPLLGRPKRRHSLG
jgi:hypothetical protein